MDSDLVVCGMRCKIKFYVILGCVLRNKRQICDLPFVTTNTFIIAPDKAIPQPFSFI